MKKICITYHMSKPGQTVEDCITLSMDDTIADNLLDDEWGASVLVKDTIKHIAAIQGYRFEGICTAEEVAE